MEQSLGESKIQPPPKVAKEKREKEKDFQQKLQGRLRKRGRKGN